MSRVLDLGDPRARDPEVVGGKVAHLAAARAAGFPVLDGAVVPAAEAGPVLARVAPALAEGGGGVAAARRLALSVPVDPVLLEELRARAAALGPALIVRSSGRLEADARWSGAFASMGDVGPDQLGTALRSIWASAFAPDALARWEEAGAPLDALALALLVQRQLATETGGTAEVLADGSARVVATRGPLGALMDGWDPGSAWLVRPTGEVQLTGGPGDGRSVVRGIAELAWDLARRTGDGFLEWAVADGALHLLQCRPVQAAQGREAEPAGITPRTGLGDPLALRLALAAAHHRATPGEELALPWATAPGAPTTLPSSTPGAAATPSTSAPGAGQALRERAAELAAQAWEAPADEALRRAGEAFAALRGDDDPRAALSAFARLQAVDPAEAADVLAELAALPGAGQPNRAALRRWEPFLREVAVAHGTATEGDGVVPGVGAGLAAVVDDFGHPRPRPGQVVVVPRPAQAIAPLLWHAAALVVRSGGRAAHLLEVAAAVGIPTVIADPPVAAGDLVAVEADTGIVHVAAARKGPHR